MKLDLILTNDWLEATWYTETITVNDVEKKVGVDEDEQPIMETVQEETVTKTQVHCESFSGHREHIDMLRAKALEFGTELDEALISECVANFKYPTEEELAQQELETKITEAKSYLTSTDWVEPYLIKHYAGIELLEADSNKFAIEAQRAEARAFLKEQGI